MYKDLDRIYLSPINQLFNNIKSKNTLFRNIGHNICFSQLGILALNQQNRLSCIDIINVSDFSKWISYLPNNLSKIAKIEYNNIITNFNISNIIPKKNPLIMGILNVTSDSFYDGGKYLKKKNAVEYAKEMAFFGADIIDVGAESTRPGAKPISVELEIKRVIPIIEELNNLGLIISCDTRNYKTMREAIKSGAKIINDISGFNNDKKIIELIAEKECFYIITHSKGAPDIMQNNPSYSSAIIEVYDTLLDKVRLALKAGVKKSKIFIDPGIGFGKLDIHNFEILKYLPVLLGSGCSIAIGTSRKSLIGRAYNNTSVIDRMPGSISLSLDAYQKGARLLRVHDIKETLQAISLLKLANI